MLVFRLVIIEAIPHSIFRLILISLSAIQCQRFSKMKIDKNEGEDEDDDKDKIKIL